MTRRQQLLDLAARCEASKGADRELDVLIGCAVKYVPGGPGCEWARAGHWQYVPMPRISERIGCADKAGNVAAHWEALGYSSSLDAATTLADGTKISAARLLQEAISRVSCLPALISQMTPDEYRRALARFFTAACLRAIAAGEDEG